MAIQYVNGSAYNESGGSTTIDSPEINAIAGNTIVVGYSHYSGTPPAIVSVEDTAGNTYTQCGNEEGGDASHKMGMFVATNINGNANNVITITWDDVATYRVINVVQYSGLVTVDVYDAAGDFKLDSGSVTDHPTNDIIITQADEVIIQFAVSWSTIQTFVESPPSNLRVVSGQSSAISDLIVSSIDTYAVETDTDIANELASVVRSFKGFIFTGFSWNELNKGDYITFKNLKEVRDAADYLLDNAANRTHFETDCPANNTSDDASKYDANQTSPHYTGNDVSQRTADQTSPHYTGNDASQYDANQTSPHYTGNDASARTADESSPHYTYNDSSQYISNEASPHNVTDLASNYGTNEATPHYQGNDTAKRDSNQTSPHYTGNDTSQRTSNQTSPHYTGNDTSQRTSNQTSPHYTGNDTSQRTSNLASPYYNGNDAAPQRNSNLASPYYNGNDAAPQRNSNLASPYYNGNDTAPQRTSNLASPYYISNDADRDSTVNGTYCSDFAKNSDRRLKKEIVYV